MLCVRNLALLGALSLRDRSLARAGLGLNNRRGVLLDLSCRGIVNAPQEPHLVHELASMRQLQQLFLQHNYLSEVNSRARQALLC